MPTEETETVATPSIFVLGPSLTGVIEPIPAAPVPTATTPGRRQIVFGVPPTKPGGNVNLKLVPPATPDDVPPINVYAFFVQPMSGVPDPSVATPDWFFKSGAASSSIHIGAADPTTGEFTITVPGVKPSLDGYHVQTILEFQGS